MCRSHHVLFFLDASQLAPYERVTMDMAAVIAYCGYKMYAPFGSGVLAGPIELLSHAGFAPTGGGNVLCLGLVENLKPEVANAPKKIINGALNPAYSLIRLSAGLVTDPNDIKKAAQKLIYINNV